MKTSNIIIVSLISGLLLIILTAALDVRLNGVHRSEAKIPLSVKKSTAFQSINHIVINDISVTIEQKDRNKVSVYYKVPEGIGESAEFEEYRQKENTIQPPDLKISGDTLFIDKDIIRGQEENKHVTVTIAEYMQSVTSNQAHLTIKGGLVRHVKVDGKRLNMERIESERQLNSISINAQNCDIRFSPIIDSLDVELVGAELNLLTRIDFLNGELKNNSNLISQDNISRLNISKDKSSNILIH